ncbi:hypothetical protein [Cohnella endophytica]|uniref:hypothetical protein n=1 Tax=Cohnella endophytica TaxID=2419778 RepID=UPI001314E660|nr:hypothetical protein [Cohnella endophytica]
MPFTVHEVDGEQPVGEWLVQKIIDFAFVELGLVVKVELIKQSSVNTSSPPDENQR